MCSKCDNHSYCNNTTIPSHVPSLNVNFISMFNEMLKHSLRSIVTLTPNFASTLREKMLTKVKML